jgi:aspartokinase-like uncharacterized kinase
MQTQLELQTEIATGNATLRVVKVGGSLLDWPPLRERLARWLTARPADATILMAGGGDFTDAVRRAQSLHGFDDETAHWLCVKALSVTARLLAQLLPNARLTGSLDELLVWTCEGKAPIVFDAADFLCQDEPQAPGMVLPHDWTATTDSIAARIAQLTSAGELVLLKSADPPPHQSLAELSAVGYVDDHFPLAAAGLPSLRLVNLRGFQAVLRE